MAKSKMKDKNGRTIKVGDFVRNEHSVGDIKIVREGRVVKKDGYISVKTLGHGYAMEYPWPSRFEKTGKTNWEIIDKLERGATSK